MNRGTPSPIARKVAGFTLLEVIITLVIASILAAAMVQFVGSGVQLSSEPLKHVSSDPVLSAVMEHLSDEYQSLRAADEASETENALALLKAFIDDKSNWNGAHAEADQVVVAHNDFVDYNTGAGSPYTETAQTNSDVLKVSLTRESRILQVLFTLR